MMQENSRLRWALLGSAILANLLCQPVRAQTPAPLPAASAAVAPTVRPEIGRVLQEAQGLLIDGKSGAAADKLRAADAVENKTPYEQHVLARLKIALAGLSGDAEFAAQQFELASQGPWLGATEKQTALRSVASLYYNAKNYAKAIEWAGLYQQAGGLEPSVNTMLAQSYYLVADYAKAASALQAEISKANAAGKAPAEIQLRLLADSRGRVKDVAGRRRALEDLVQHYPSQANWRALLAQFWGTPSLAPRLHLHVFRLQSISAGLTEAGDYTDMARLALQEGSATEAGKVLEQGDAAAVLSASDRAVQDLRDKLGAAAAQDRRTLEADLLRARSMPDGLALFNYGFNLFHTGQTERGLAQMEQALAKGIARNGDLARLRLVAAYAQVKERDKALQLLTVLADRNDPVGLEDLVRYWKLFLRPA